MKNRIAVISVIYKNPKKQIEGLEKSLLVNGVAKKDIFFVDNEKDNIGYGAAINKVVKRILKQVQDDKEYDYFFIVNPDVVLHKDCLKQLLQSLEENPEVGIVGPKILDEKGKIWAIGGILDKVRYSGGLIDYGKENNLSTSSVKQSPSNDNNIDVDYVPGTAMLIRREVFEKVGFFAKDYFLYYEDNDFCLRAKRLGFNLVINPTAEITHFASSSTGKNSPLMQYYMARNHMLFVERFAPQVVKMHEIIRMPKTIFQATGFERLGIRDYFLRRFGKRDYWS